MGSDGLPGPTDSWVTLAGLARETSTVRLGTLVTSATFRHPGPLAISVAEVDAMSGGRVELGLGAGWFEAEHAAYGLPFPDTKERFDRFEEQLAVITGLWRTPVGETVLVRRRPLHGHRLAGPAQADGAGRAADHRRRPRQAPDAAARRLVCGGVQRRLLVGAGRRGAVRPGPRGVRHRRSRPRLAGLLRRADGLLRPRRRRGPPPRRGHRTRPARAAGQRGRRHPAECVETIGRYASVGAERVYLQVLDLADLDHLDLLAAEVNPRSDPPRTPAPVARGRLGR